jgi:S-adenosylmethionine synthetase
MRTMKRKILVSELARCSIEDEPVELCEHKGIGHPDTLTDRACEAVSRDLSLAYLERYGRILHHNLDKGLLIAGKSAPQFGGGKWLEPMRLVICGTATQPHADLNVTQLAHKSALASLSAAAQIEAEHFLIEPIIEEGSDSLKQVFSRQDEMPVANDTSFGVGFAPYSRLERCVSLAAETLRSADFKLRFPAAGNDFKVMGHRIEDTIALTIAVAFIDRHVSSVSHYFTIKQGMETYLRGTLPHAAAIRINTLDDPDARDEAGVYLTVSGLSAEMGDCGQVGRGNRVNGLITLGRCMSLEAAAGKNPVAHVGKLYNVLATLMARDIHAALDDIAEVRIQLLSAIGRPIDDPQVAAIQILGKSRVSDNAKGQAYDIADEWLSSIQTVTFLILQGKVTLF